MKKILILFLLTSTTALAQTNVFQKTSNPTPATNDLVYVVDVSNTTQSANGSGSKATVAQLFSAGNLTVSGTSVGIGKTPTATLDVNGKIKAATLDTGLGIGSIVSSAGINIDGNNDGIADLAISSAGVITATNDIVIPADVYGSGWNGVQEAAPKDAVYDKIETLGGGGGASNLDGLSDVAISSLAINQVLVSDGTNFRNKTLIGDVTVGSTGASTIDSAYKGWTDTGSSVYLTATADSVGIGLIIPTAKLSINDGNVGIGTAVTRNIINVTGRYTAAGINDNIRAVYVDPHFTGNATAGLTTSGIYVQNYDDSITGTNPHHLAIVGRSYKTGASTNTVITGIYGTSEIDGGTATTAHGVLADPVVVDGASSVATTIRSVAGSNSTLTNSGTCSKQSALYAPLTSGCTASNYSIVAGGEPASGKGIFYGIGGGLGVDDFAIVSAGLVHTISSVVSASGTDKPQTLTYSRSNSNTGTTGGITGIDLTVNTLDASGTVALAKGAQITSVNGNSNTTTQQTALGILLRTTSASAITTLMSGFKIDNITNSGTITDLRAVDIGDITTGTQTNVPYSIYSSDANAYNYFGGNIGIGTLLPNAQVQASKTTGGQYDLHRVDSSASTGESLGLLTWSNNDTQLTTQQIYGQIDVQAAQTINTDAAAGNMIFSTTGTDVGGSPIARMTITSSGNVGIGTSVPTATLDVVGALRINGTFKIDGNNDGGPQVIDSTDNTACNTICNSACGFGFDVGTVGVINSKIVTCSDSSADICYCWGPT